MGLDSIWHWLILLIIVLALFGTSKLTKIGPDIGNAVREFKKALRGDDKDDSKSDDDTLRADPPAQATAESAQKQERHDTGSSK
ncbi:MAG TPA: twin-arginine translocase TatA/TatE family subunit [Oleiagrimonas sp.]|nr:twin-arginine translocase TatA/TatE family subunit [Oleiagrimonas sp.]